ncbi:MAG: hypothetical protein ACOZIN_20150 [Myxococcota bacterium]
MEPKRLLEALRSKEALPPELVPADAQKARTLLDLSAPPATEVEALPEPLALAVLESTVQRRHLELPLALSTSPHKALAKAAKKALYQLKSMGVALPPAPRASTSTSPSPEAAEELPCLLSPVTGTGERALVVVRPLRGGGLETIQCVLSDEVGLLQLDAGEVGRAGYRRQLKELREGKVPFLQIPLSRARALLSDAAALNQTSTSPLPPGAGDALRHLGVEPSLATPPPLPSPEPDDERQAAHAHLLHDEPEVRPWLPPEAQLRLLAQRLEDLEASPLTLSAAQKDEQALQKMRATAREFFTVPMKQLYARRLWAMAEVFEHTGRTDKAQTARAEARRLFHGVGESRFAEALFEKVVLLSHLAQTGQLPPPGEGPPEKSPGGILFP